MEHFSAKDIALQNILCKILLITKNNSSITSPYYVSTHCNRSYLLNNDREHKKEQEPLTFAASILWPLLCKERRDDLVIQYEYWCSISKLAHHVHNIHERRPVPYIYIYMLREVILGRT